MLCTLFLPLAPVATGVTPPAKHDEVTCAAFTPAPATVTAAPASLVPATPRALDEAQQASAQASPGDAIIVTATQTAPRLDPLQGVNRKSFQVTQSTDRAVVAPLATAYAKVMPKPFRAGLRNFFTNLNEPIVAINFVLQGHPGKGAEALGRFAINSTIGIAGLFDAAHTKAFKLPHRANGFADTLACYGVGAGPYLFLPLIGATTVRDLAGSIVDRSTVLALVGPPLNTPAFSIPAGVVRTLERRAEFEDQLAEVGAAAHDSYGARRKLYFKQRNAEIDGLQCRHASQPHDHAAFVAPVVASPAPVTAAAGMPPAEGRSPGSPTDPLRENSPAH